LATLWAPVLTLLWLSQPSAQTIVQQAQLLPNGSAGDQFGHGVAIDGTTMVVGAPRDDVGANGDQGSAYVYDLVNGVWVLQAHLFANDGAGGDWFGGAVAIAGTTVIIGAAQADIGANDSQGAAYVFRRSGATWTQEAKLTVAGAAGDAFGAAVAAYADRVLVGATGVDGVTADQGTAYVFLRTKTGWEGDGVLKSASDDRYLGTSVALGDGVAAVGAVWTPVAGHLRQGVVRTYVHGTGGWAAGPVLTPADGDGGEEFGSNLALDGNTLLVSGQNRPTGGPVYSGAVWVYVRTLSTWTQQTMLVLTEAEDRDSFGGGLALDGNTALIGAAGDDGESADDQGAAYVYTRTGSTWTQRARLTSPGGTADDHFGIAVALQGGIAAVGAHRDDVATLEYGSVSVFGGAGATWTPKAWLSATDDASSTFGNAVAVSGDTIIVGAAGTDVGANNSQGAAYAFRRYEGTWTLEARLTADDGAAGDLFGGSVAVDGSLAVIGARGDDGFRGAAYVFTRDAAGAWSQHAKLVASDRAANDLFGAAVALDGTYAIVGAPYANGTLVDQGKAYVFSNVNGTPVERLLTASDPAANDNFGTAVSIDGMTAVVGATGVDAGDRSNQGAAYGFRRIGSAWFAEGRFLAPDAEANDSFGAAVAVHGDTALIGAPNKGGDGRAFAFVRAVGWAWQATLAASPGTAWQLGHAVSVSNDTAVVGATSTDSARGSLHVFLRTGSSWAERQRLLAADGQAGDMHGFTVALGGDVAVGGVPHDAFPSRGSAAVFTGLCFFEIAPPAIMPAATSGGQVVTVNAGQSACAWSTTSQAAWLTFDGPGTGTGDGSVTVRFAANTGPARSGTMTIAGQTFTVTQASGCAFTLGSSGESPGATGGTATVGLTATNAACAWTAVSNAPSWLSVTSPAGGAGTGSATISYDVLPNTGPARTGTLTIAGRTLTVTQASGCTFGLSGSTTAVVAAGGEASVGLTTSDASCAWSATSHAPWLTLVPPVNGVGTRTLSYAIAANAGPARTGTLTIAGQTLTVTQAGGCTYTLLATSFAVSALGGFPSTALLASDNACPWTAVSHVPWVALTPPSTPSGTGNATIALAVEPNPGAARTGTLTVAGQTLTVNQSAWGCSFTVTPLSVTAPATGLGGTLTITAPHGGCTWTATAGDAWLIFPAGATGSGSATLPYQIAPNFTATDRVGSVSVGGYVVAVTQAGTTCTYGVTPTALAFDEASGTRTLDLTTSEATCTWTVTGTTPWLSLTPTSGTGPAALTVTAASNLDVTRRATLAIASQAVAVSQAGSATPTGPGTVYLAEGATGDFFDTEIALLNPGNTAADVTLRYLRASGDPVTETRTIPPLRRATVWPEALLGPAEFATLVESSQRLVVDRTMAWDTRGYGGHAETAVAAPALTWYLAEGATHSGFALFYLIQNPNAVEAQVEVRYLRPAPAPVVVKPYAVPPHSRFNIWVNREGPELANTDVSAVVRVLDDQPVIVERAMYLDAPGHAFNAGHESAGVTQPALTWFLAEGATGPYFDLFVLLANPNPTPADVRVTYLLPDGTTYTKTTTVDANARANLWVDYETPDGTTGTPLADTAVSTTVTVTNDVPIIVERAMWWPGSPGPWHEAHNSPGATATGTVWALAAGEEGGDRATQTYILVANTSATAGAATVTLLFEDGTSARKGFALPPNSRTNVAVASDFPEAVGRRFGALIESTGTPAAQLVVERAMYWNAEGVNWAAGTNAMGTRLR
jgi:hypothetical protein